MEVWFVINAGITRFKKVKNIFNKCQIVYISLFYLLRLKVPFLNPKVFHPGHKKCNFCFQNSVGTRPWLPSASGWCVATCLKCCRQRFLEKGTKYRMALISMKSSTNQKLIQSQLVQVGVWLIFVILCTVEITYSKTSSMPTSFTLETKASWQNIFPNSKI